MSGKKSKSKGPKTRKALIKSLTKDLAIESSGNGYIIIKELAQGAGFQASLITACKEGDKATNCLDIALGAAEAARLIHKGKYKAAGYTVVEVGTKKLLCWAASGAAATAASGIAYAGVGGTLLEVGVTIGICNPPVLVVVAPIAAGAAVAIAVFLVFRRRKR